MIRRLLQCADWLDYPVKLLGRWGSWLIIPLILTVLFDAVSRRYLRRLDFVIEHDLHHLMNSPKLQDAEWHLHTMMFCLAIGYACVYSAHVRLDLFRAGLGPRGRLWVELFGSIVLLLPFLAVLIASGWDFFLLAWIRDEGPSAVVGLPNRWFVKAFLVGGFALSLAATASLLIRLGVRLFGPAELAGATRTGHLDQDERSPFE